MMNIYQAIPLVTFAVLGVALVSLEIADKKAQARNRKNLDDFYKDMEKFRSSFNRRPSF